MLLVNIEHYGPVTSCELGWSVVGRPSWTVRMYVLDGICIDTGQSRMRRQAMEFLAPFAIHQVLLTHHHEDHSGNAAVIKDTRRVPVYGHPLAVDKLRTQNRILPYQRYMWGASPLVNVLPLPERVESHALVLTPIHTPGHSKDHVVYWEENNGWLFSGDLFLAERIKYFRSDERMKDQIDSLRKIKDLAFDSLFCAHNPKPENGKKRLAAKLQFLEDLYGHIQKLWQQGLSIEQIARTIGLKETYSIKLICLGNVSMKNMIRSAIQSFR